MCFYPWSHSSGVTVKYGVTQGPVLGPILFYFYTNHMLADDTTLHTTGKSVVQIKKHTHTTALF